MDEPRTGRSWRKLALLLAVPVAAVAMWASVALAGGGSQERSRADVAKPAVKAQKKHHAGAPAVQRNGEHCPFKDAGLTSADV